MNQVARLILCVMVGVPASKMDAVLPSVIKYMKVIHKKGFIHRDLRLSNILFYDQKPLIVDWGCASHTSDPFSFELLGGVRYQPQTLRSKSSPSSYYEMDLRLCLRSLYAIRYSDVQQRLSECKDYSAFWSLEEERERWTKADRGRDVSWATADEAASLLQYDTLADHLVVLLQSPI